MWLTDDLVFPDVDKAMGDGLLAIGGDLSITRLKLAYQNGIFPWYSSSSPILWFSPPQRMVLFPEMLKVSKSMRQLLKKQPFCITENKAFKEVIHQCRHICRKDEIGTWITDDMEKAYCNLHSAGIAKSIEVWQNEKLVGGLYGVDTNGVFCGESMFSKVPNASKTAFIHLARHKKYRLIDCQMHTPHLASLGATEIPRERFLKILQHKG